MAKERETPEMSATLHAIARQEAVASNSHRPLQVALGRLALEQRVRFCLSCLSRPPFLALNDSCAERLCGVA